MIIFSQMFSNRHCAVSTMGTATKRDSPSCGPLAKMVRLRAAQDVPCYLPYGRGIFGFRDLPKVASPWRVKQDQIPRRFDPWPVPFPTQCVVSAS